jgi:cysteinyl-tRNA synthetase
MDDDINVSNALAAVFSTIREGNSLIAQAPDASAAAAASAAGIATKLQQVRSMLDVFGLDPLSTQWSTSQSGGEDGAITKALDALVSAQLEARTQARKDKNFAQADAIRDQLNAAGIEIEDSAQGSSWHVR